MSPDFIGRSLAVVVLEIILKAGNLVRILLKSPMQESEGSSRIPAKIKFPSAPYFFTEYIY